MLRAGAGGSIIPTPNPDPSTTSMHHLKMLDHSVAAQTMKGAHYARRPGQPRDDHQGQQAAARARLPSSIKVYHGSVRSLCCDRR
mmetsp:Transcript_34754/g.69235  ORF Transcript_34754/g.69235 Transcript_34754/m.69235 type:complete len:85 (+) Transcript_34754:3-257(+)